jgi:hypothetical protein
MQIGSIGGAGALRSQLFDYSTNVANAEPSGFVPTP